MHDDDHLTGAGAARVHSFAPVARADARVLILGSMPGVASLAAGQYYAHRRNVFWPLMAQIFAFAPDLPYAERVARLQAQRLALWDVLATCERPGSLDSAIVAQSAKANDFARLFARCRQIERVFFNGAAASRLFERHVLRAGVLAGRQIAYQRLPSTSPAHAALSPAEKLAAWRCVAH